MPSLEVSADGFLWYPADQLTVEAIQQVNPDIKVRERKPERCGICTQEILGVVVREYGQRWCPACGRGLQ